MDVAGVGVTPRVTNYVVNHKTNSFLSSKFCTPGPQYYKDLSYLLLNKGLGNYMDLASNHLLCVPTICQALTLPGILVFQRQPLK